MARLEALFDVAVLAPPDTDRVNEARRIVDEGHDKSHTAPAAQRASLRWVATLVARGVAPSGVFEAVAKELGRCLSVDRAAVFRYEPDGKATLVASGGEPRLDKAAVGGRFPAHGENLGRTALLPRGRVTATDINENAGCSADARIRVMGLCLGVGVPIVVGGTVWGGVIAGSSRPQPLPPDSEDRIEDYAVLIAMAIENAAIRAELTASRARVVAAADDARRRLERDLHDGAQQRLVSLALKLRMTEDSLPPGLGTPSKSRSLTSLRV